jgi:hypothetical protein
MAASSAADAPVMVAFGLGVVAWFTRARLPRLALPVALGAGAIGIVWWMRAHGDASEVAWMAEAELLLVLVPTVVVAVSAPAWRGRRAAATSVLACALVAAAYVVVFVGWHDAAIRDPFATGGPLAAVAPLALLSVGILVWWRLTVPANQAPGASRRLSALVLSHEAVGVLGVAMLLGSHGAAGRPAGVLMIVVDVVIVVPVVLGLLRALDQLPEPRAGTRWAGTRWTAVLPSMWTAVEELPVPSATITSSSPSSPSIR